ncbi:ribonuclease H [Caulobacter sp. D4A]|uniref:ribonuclease H n=1 Tax=unclassified Caulobacter TaxID=2648921 RepID=UPI000D726C71|nr:MULTISPECIES: ribonuclease H [unclassified Caulobacter]PXA79518.1 ribonuclease H [Caulobacter sp. D4A]PXA92605.1 ribonuclease H [Caulobacter sp. D5]
MTSPAVTLWTAALCKQDPGYGGWAFVRRQDGESGAAAIKGAAGGERRTSLAKMSLTALIEALTSLSDLPADAAVTLRFADPALAGELVASDGAYAAAEPEAWAAARTLVAARPVLNLVPLAAGAPASGFLTAWAEFGLDTSKSRGSFKAAIPKPNLLKFPG